MLRPLQVQVQLILDKQVPLPKSDKEKLQSRLRAISRLLEQNKGKVPRLYEEFRTGNISREQFVNQKDAISSANNELDSERSEIEEKLHAIESAQKKTESESLLEITRLKTLTQNAVDLFVSKVVVNSPDSIEITWKSKDLFDEIYNRNA